MADEEIVKTVCFMCHICCGIDAHLKDGKLERVTPMKEHLFNRLCVKTQGMTEWLYSKDRITSPLRKVDGEWRKVSWDEALDIIANKLGDIREQYEAKALVYNAGEPLINTNAPRAASRFMSLYGTPNHTSGATLCFAARGIGHGLTISNRMFALGSSYSDSKCLIIWGFNPQESNVKQLSEITTARTNGAKLIVVDPRVIPLAKQADIHIQVKPGTDIALALGLLNVIITERLYDEEFVRNQTTGFEKLEEHVREYNPETVEQITWVPAKAIREFARMYATNKPAVIAQGVALDHSLNGVQTSRAISTLVAITGNLDITGGNIYNSPQTLTSLRVSGRVNVNEVLGARYPIFNRFVGQTTAIHVPDAILTEQPYPVKALIVQASNPAVTWPDSGKVREALNKLDLLVVIDFFMTETAKLADIFLPATSFLERKTLKDYNFEGVPLIAVANKVIEPLGDSKDDWEIWSELGKRMGYAEYFPWQNSEELITHLLEPSEISLSTLEENPGGVLYADLARQQKYTEKGFDTPSGKVEIYSSIMEKNGYDPLPAFIDNQSGFTDEYPFILISGPRVSAFTHSQYRDVPRLKRLVPDPLVEMNINAAKDLDIHNGDQVILESPRGRIQLEAELTKDIHPQVISAQHGWDEANINFLTDAEVTDPVSGYPAFKCVPCRVLKINS
ncbi:molybdopterin-dependent oxidoreductase [Chloroflexota bacterium]